MKILTMLASAIIGLFLSCIPALAGDLQVVLDGGWVLAQYRYQGHTLVLGCQSKNYTLRFKNTLDRRVLVVPAVDGIWTTNGQVANPSAPAQGYVVPPGESIEVPGYNLNTKEVARFKFDKPSKSFSVQTGHGIQNVGVIGALVLREALPNEDEQVFTSKSGGSNNRSLGTAFGKRESFPVQQVIFTAEDEPYETIVLRYTDARGLQKYGHHVSENVCNEGRSNDPLLDAQPFPGFGVTPPPGWRGK